MVTELVAGEADDLEVVGVLGLQFFVQLLKAFELWCETAFRGCIDDEDDFAFELVEGKRLTFLCRRTRDQLLREGLVVH